ncbi:ras-related protein Rab-18-like [Clytia hemisphaerica]|uniref:Uncharacterized protein n=1 Tax=Clytia hemisphaerica TaxID=252671 RepID=A0A7M5UHI5_9CNID
MAKTSSRPNSTYDDGEVIGLPVKFGSGRWKNTKQVSGTRFKICLCGKSKVGKTSIFMRLQGLDFAEDDPNCPISNFEFKDENDSTVEYSISDPESIDIDSLTFGDHYRNAHCVVLIYDVTDFSSLDYLSYEMEKIEKNNYTPYAKYVLLRNKIDKKSSKHIPLAKQKEFFANSKLRLKIDHVVETSAKTNEGILEFFKEELPELLVLPSSESKVKAFDRLVSDSQQGLDATDSSPGGRKKKKKKRINCATS